MKKVSLLFFPLLSFFSSSSSYKFPVIFFQEHHSDTYSTLEQSVSEHVDQFCKKSEFNCDELTLNIQHAAFGLAKNNLETIYHAAKILILASAENFLNETQLSRLNKKANKHRGQHSIGTDFSIATSIGALCKKSFLL